MQYLKFIHNHKRLLAFGFVLTLFSTFGQTIFVSVFVPEFLREFSITKGEFATIYSGGTLVGALLLPFLGQKIDQISLRRYSLFIVFGVIVACFLISSTINIPMLFAGFLGLRLFAQGLLPHTSNTTIARYFDRYRGKALSLANLGLPIGQGLFPLVFTFILIAVGWRTCWVILGCLTIVLLVPYVILSTRDGFNIIEPEPPNNQNHTPRKPKDSWSRAQVLRDYRFYFLLPANIIPAFFLTGLFLYQFSLAQSKNWSVEWVASSFVAFAVCRLFSSLLVGFLVDQYGANRLFPYYLVPLGMGLLLLALVDNPIVYPVYLGLAGTTVGFGSSIKSALWAEIYGVRHLGAIRSLQGSLLVFSTALGPLLVGFYMDAGANLTYLLIAFVLAIIVFSAVSIWTCRQYHPA